MLSSPHPLRAGVVPKTIDLGSCGGGGVQPAWGQLPLGQELWPTLRVPRERVQLGPCRVLTQHLPWHEQQSPQERCLSSPCR